MSSSTFLTSQTPISYRLNDGTELPLTIRVSPRSRYLRLRITSQQGAILSAPKRIGQKDLEAFLRQQQGWMARHWSTLGPEYHRQRKEQRELPSQIVLPGLGEIWAITLVSGDGGLDLTEDTATMRLTLRGQVSDDSIEAMREMLQTWLRLRAKRYLPAWLARLAQRHGFRYTTVSVRNQRGRWGSCSANGGISLNCKLLLLPAEQTTHVLLHELCHTVYLNHSAKFWQLLRRVDPATDSLQSVLDQAWLALPGWCR